MIYHFNGGFLIFGCRSLGMEKEHQMISKENDLKEKSEPSTKKQYFFLNTDQTLFTQYKTS
jgi:hypothetical protein